MRVSMVCKKSYDFVVVGAGNAGLNALRAIQTSSPKASVLCIDRNSQPGGSWNHYYPFVKLHQPHPSFGVNGHPWHLKDRNVLAGRRNVLRHFADFRSSLPSNFEFSWGSSCKVWCQRLDGRVDIDYHTTDGPSSVDAHCVIDARGYDYVAQTQRSACKHAAGPNDVDEISINELPVELERRKASGKDTLYVVIGGGLTGMNATIYVAANRSANDESVLITGSPKYFTARERIWNPSRYNVLFPSTAESFSFFLTEFDGTRNKSQELLKRAEDSGLLLRVGAAQPDHLKFGTMSVREKETVQGSARIVQNDYFVRCEVSTADSRRLVMSSGMTLETKKEVVLINCRSSLPRGLGWASPDVHPLRPDGSLRCGIGLLGTSGSSAYGITLLHLKGKSDISMYGCKHAWHDDARSQFSVETLCKSSGNLLKLGAELGNDELRKMTTSADYWLPAPRKVYSGCKMMWHADKIIGVCEQTLNKLQPYDGQACFKHDDGLRSEDNHSRLNLL